jgi:hypothetical protein
MSAYLMPMKLYKTPTETGLIRQAVYMLLISIYFSALTYKATTNSLLTFTLKLFTCCVRFIFSTAVLLYILRAFIFQMLCCPSISYVFYILVARLPLLFACVLYFRCGVAFMFTHYLYSVYLLYMRYLYFTCYLNSMMLCCLSCCDA